jgi:hypothetical protein
MRGGGRYRCKRYNPGFDEDIFNERMTQVITPPYVFNLRGYRVTQKDVGDECCEGAYFDDQRPN